MDNVKEATQEAQRVAKVADDTDLEAAAQFDIFGYLKQKGIETQSLDDVSS